MNCLRRECMLKARNSFFYIKHSNEVLPWKYSAKNIFIRLSPVKHFSNDIEVVYRYNNRVRLGLSNFIGGYSSRFISGYESKHQSGLSVQSLQYNSAAGSSYPWLPQSSAVRLYSKSKSSEKPESSQLPQDNDSGTEKLSLFQKFKKMYRDYWYVLIPVHCATSIVWFGAFYAAATSGIDIVSILEFLNVSENLIAPFRNGEGHAKHAGLIAVAFALYKIATPIRYAVTLGGTTLAINYLTKLGYIRPLPRKEKLKEMYLERKGILLEKSLYKTNVLQRLKAEENHKRMTKKDLTKKNR